jgi:Uma2 family endonuclease
MATSTRPAATEEDLLAAPEDGFKRELVDGEIRVSPAGFRHGVVCVELITRLASFVEERRLGFVVDSSTGFRLPSGNLRLPDVAFVAKGRFEDDTPTVGFSPVPPDLAVEVLSPSDRPRQVLDRIGEYLEAGVRLVWVIDPEGRRATVHRSLSDVKTVDEAGVLDGEDVVPGFTCPVAAIL